MIHTLPPNEGETVNFPTGRSDIGPAGSASSVSDFAMFPCNN